MLNALWESFSTKNRPRNPGQWWNQILLISSYQLPLAWKEYHLFDDFFEIKGYPPTPQEIRPPSSPSKASSLTHWLIYKKLLAPVPAYAVGPPSQNLWHSLREETSAHGDCANGRLRRFNFVKDVLTKYSWWVIFHPSQKNARKSNLGIICISPSKYQSFQGINLSHTQKKSLKPPHNISATSKRSLVRPHNPCEVYPSVTCVRIWKTIWWFMVVSTYS